MKKYGYNIIASDLINEISKEKYRISWELRLKNQIKDLVDYDIVKCELESLINNKFAVRNE